MKSVLTVTISPRDGFRIALRLLWESFIAAIHRTTVTFEAVDKL